MLTHVCEQFTHGSLWMQAKRSSRDFRMSTLLLETGPTVILDEKSHTNLRHFTRMCIPSLPNGFLEVQRERVHTRANLESHDWQIHQSKHTGNVLCSVVLCSVALCCCVVLCCVVLCSIVLYSAVLCSIVLSRKAFISHLHTNIERHFWGLPVASPMTPSPWKYFFWHNLGRSFHTCCQIEAILKTAKFFKLTKIWGPGELFHHKCHRKYVILTG